MGERKKRRARWRGLFRGLGDISIYGKPRITRVEYSNPYPRGATDEETLRGDWERVGRDLRAAIDKVVPLDIRQQVEPEVYGEREGQDGE